MKRRISFLLAAVLLLSMCPIPAQAQQNSSNAGLTNTTVTVDTTNGFSTLLNEDISQYQQDTAQEEAKYEAGYSVVDLKIEGNTATIVYSSLEDAVLVVALYTEDGCQMITSAFAQVYAEEDTVTLTFDENMPEYFLASAYLMDNYDLSPLCASYDTPMYTQEMQELMASTIDDYNPEQVLNLDNDDTTNFAVYADGTIIIEGGNGVNLVATADHENAYYVIHNADEQITELQTGDVFVYPYGENELLIAKVGSIIINDTTVTIIGDEVELEDVFSCVKIDGQVSQEDAQVESQYAGPGVRYTGKSIAKQEAPQPWGFGPSVELVLSYKLDIKEDINLTGNLTLKAEAMLEFYITKSFVRTKLALDYSLTIDAQMETNAKSKPIKVPIGWMKFPICPGVTIGCEPALIVSGNVSTKITLGIAGTFGVACNFPKDGPVDVDNLCTHPSVQAEFNAEGTIFVGLSLPPSVGLFGGLVLDLEIDTQIGAEIKGALSLSTDLLDDISHPDYSTCLAGEVYLVHGASISAKIFNMKYTVDIINNGKFKLFDFYFNPLYGEIGFGKCPNISYKLTVHVIDEDKRPVENAYIAVNNASYTTNSEGVAEFYLPTDLHLIQVISGELSYSAQLYMDHARKLTAKLTPHDKDETIASIGGVLGELAALGEVVDSGTQGTNIYWKLYSSGLLSIGGIGPMKNSLFQQSAPWDKYRSSITTVKILNGVTSIDNSAFSNYENLERVVIPSSVTSIGAGAFRSCDSLAKIIVDANSASYSSDAYGVLFDKSKNTLVQAPGALTGTYSIPDSVTTINDYAFAYCDKLDQITIGNRVTSIGESAFYSCDNLISVTIGNNVTTIGEDAFSYCHSLTSIAIPASVTSIGSSVFYSCDSLTRIDVDKKSTAYSSDAYGVLFDKSKNTLIRAPGAITGSYSIPSSVTTIQVFAFDACNSLTSVTIPASVISIRAAVFRSCKNLTAINVDSKNDVYSSDAQGVLFDKHKTMLIQAPGAINGSYSLPTSVTSIEDYAFYRCGNLTSVIIPNGTTTIDDWSFYQCNNLSSISIPVSVTDIGDWAFVDCNSLTDVYYSGTEQKWAHISIGYSNSCLTDATIHFSSTAPTYFNIPSQQPAVSVENMEQVSDTLSTDNTIPTFDAVYPGHHGTETSDGYTLNTAFFTNLTPGEQYILLVMKSIEVDNPLSADNLLFIDQDTAQEDTSLLFKYVQRKSSDVSYVVACGASHKNLNNAEITFPGMISTDTLQAVTPTVVYDGSTLEEGRDYVITGTVSFTDPGTYTCYIRGIHSYTGFVECTYTVDEPAFIYGDTNGDSKVNGLDLILLRQHLAGWDVELDTASADVNGNGTINGLDLILLRQHLAGWDVTLGPQ